MRNYDTSARFRWIGAREKRAERRMKLKRRAASLGTCRLPATTATAPVLVRLRRRAPNVCQYRAQRRIGALRHKISIFQRHNYASHYGPKVSAAEVHSAAESNYAPVF